MALGRARGHRAGTVRSRPCHVPTVVPPARCASSGRSRVAPTTRCSASASTGPIRCCHRPSRSAPPRRRRSPPPRWPPPSWGDCATGWFSRWASTCAMPHSSAARGSASTARPCRCGTSCRRCTPAAAKKARRDGCASMPTSPTTATVRCACSACRLDDGVEPAQVRQALAAWSALDFEQAAAAAGLVVAALRRFDEWDAHPQGRALAAQPPLQIDAHWRCAAARAAAVAGQLTPAEGLARARPDAHPGRAGGYARAGGLWRRRAAGQFAPSAQHRRHRRHQPRQAVGPCRPARAGRPRGLRRGAARRACVRAGLPARRPAAPGLRRRGLGRALPRHRGRVAVGLWP